ncbi:MAG: hypothetical protein H6838_16055 [Planctomycetes bacterium]|nr:hypothetical protein [Planctomycetota bacterium]MCB9887006.1 hypothetical protein [Planctomycetota bacterium]
MFAAVLFCLCCLLAPLAAQDPPSTSPTPPATAQAPGKDAPGLPQQAPPQGKPLDATTKLALERLATAIREKREQRTAAEARSDQTAMQRLEVELRDLRWQFANLATRLDVQEFELPSAKSFDLQAEVIDFLQPVVEELRDATAGPRQISDLKREIAALQARQTTAEAALRQTERTRDELPAGSDARAEAEREIAVRWAPKINDLRRQLLVLTSRLGALVDGQPTLLQRIWSGVGSFLQKSGLSLILAILVFLVTFTALRWVRRRILRRTTRGRTFANRLFDVVSQVLIVLIAITATIIVPYARDDFLLLAIAILFLLGVGWLTVKTAPQMFEQFRLLLNVGAVREGERIVIDGLPYRVASLRFYARLENPDLQGGSLRLPVRDLVGKHSRPTAPHEPWFPSCVGDVVQLADGVFGPVLVQTPQTVVVQDYGAERSYPTPDYLAQRPRNLSRGFAVETAFRLDYALVQQATTTVPEVLAAGLERGLRERLPDAQLVAVQVLFRAAGDSSLDYQAVATFTGEAAPRFLELRAAVPEVLLATATAQGWKIPFPQLTVHRQS